MAVCGDPPVAVVELVSECVARLLAPKAELGADRDHLVVGLDDGDLGDAAFEPSTAQLTPPGAERAEAEFHHGLEGEHNGFAADELAVGVGERVGAVVEQPADDHRVHDDARGPGLAHVSASASWNAFHSSSVMSSTTRGGRELAVVGRA